MKKKILIVLLFIFSIHIGKASVPFVTVWSTYLSNDSNIKTIQIPLNSKYDYDFFIDWGNGKTQKFIGLGDTLKVFHEYLQPGIYTIKIDGNFPGLDFSRLWYQNQDAEKLLFIDQWGSIRWKTFNNAFSGCRNLNLRTKDMPDLYEVSDISSMFANCEKFNYPIQDWDISNVKNMSFLFYGASTFNQPLEGWDMKNVTNIHGMFYRATSFNQPLEKWDLSQITDLESLFYYAISFNQPLEKWNVGNVTNMKNLFHGSSFNYPLESWDVSKVIDMSGMFSGLDSFNFPLEKWNIENVITMDGMFASAYSFNQPLEKWDIKNVKSMERMFYNTKYFNQPLEKWDFSGVENVSRMFTRAHWFNQPLEKWDMSKKTNLNYMFERTIEFNQPLGKWDVSGVVSMYDMMFFSNIDCENYDETLIGWSKLNLQKNIYFSARDYIHYTSKGEAARNLIINKFNWRIDDGGLCGLGIRNKWSGNMSVKVFPNPAQKEIHFEFENAEIKTIELIDLVGKTAISEEVNSNLKIIDISLLTAGVYYYKVIFKTGIGFRAGQIVITK